jgi:ABC-type spermidine/putrescine transport system permease subunit I
MSTFTDLPDNIYVLESKRHDMIGKSTPRGIECGFILIFWMNLNLIIARELVHEGQGLMAGTTINNLVDERRWEVVFGTDVIEIMKVSAYMNSALFFIDKDGVGDP